MRIEIVGAGVVGGYSGGRFAAAGAEVAFLARGSHLEAMRAGGLLIRSPKGDVHLPGVRAVADPNDIGHVEVVLLAVKLYDTDAALALLPPLIGRDTAVIPLQNGVDGVSSVLRAVGHENTAGGTCYVSAVIETPGVIRHTAMDHLIFGELDVAHQPRPRQLLDVWPLTKFPTTLSGNRT